MCRHAIVTFLEKTESLKYVDLEFRSLVEVLHRIPYCASFGVSCAGHFYENQGPNTWPQAGHFRPSLWGNLNVILLPTEPHIREFMELMTRLIGSFADTTFQRTEHVFGPPKTSKLEVWEIRIGPNGCLGEKGQEIELGSSPPKQGNESLFEASKARYEEIKRFWEALATELTKFSEGHNFGDFDLEKRVEELEKRWKE